jgi:hypothetical protein
MLLPLKPAFRVLKAGRVEAKASRLAQRAVKSGREDHEKRCGAIVAAVPSVGHPDQAS